LDKAPASFGTSVSSFGPAIQVWGRPPGFEPEAPRV
jgi:hypothetical protein